MHDASDNTLNAFQMPKKAVVITVCGYMNSSIAGRKIISHKIEVYCNEDASLRTADWNFLHKDIFKSSGSVRCLWVTAAPRRPSVLPHDEINEQGVGVE
jgi:hypothetical protein